MLLSFSFFVCARHGRWDYFFREVLPEKEHSFDSAVARRPLQVGLIKAMPLAAQEGPSQHKQGREIPALNLPRVVSGSER